MALAAMKKFPKGFSRYKDKEASMSNALNKFFRENELFPTTDHKIYSFRHAFEDRLKEAGIDDELRRLLMGHAIDRPKYGSGGRTDSIQTQYHEQQQYHDFIGRGGGYLPADADCGRQLTHRESGGRHTFKQCFRRHGHQQCDNHDNRGAPAFSR